MPIIDIEKVIERMDGVKILKSVALKVFQMADDPETTADDITEVVEEDDYLTALILRVANSSFYGNIGKVKNINDSVVLLGFTGIKSIAIAASLMAKRDDDKVSKSEIIVRERLWRHAISTAISAKFLADKLGYKDGGKAYVSGIVHDIGRLAIFQYDNKSFHDAEKYSLEKGIEVSEAEIIINGLDHAQVGAILLKKWNFPQDIVKTVAYHHRFVEEVEDKELLALVIIANFISNSLGFGSANIPAMDPRVMRVYGLDYEKIKKYIEEISGILSHIEILSFGM